MSGEEAGRAGIEKRILSRFFSCCEEREHADIYAVQNLPQEIRATLNGLYSRSHRSMRETFLARLAQGLKRQGRTLEDLALPSGTTEEALAGILTEKAGVFLRTYAIDHGHNSLREGAVVQLAVEKVSQLVTRFLQRERRASFEESSTRYLSFGQEGHWRDPEVMAAGPPWSELYEEALSESRALYRASLEDLESQIRRERPPGRDEEERAYERALRAEAFDSARYLCQPALLTKFGLVADARTISDLVSRLLSHPLKEFRIVGERLREEAGKELPTLLAHAKPRGYEAATLMHLRELSGRAGPSSGDPEEALLRVRLLSAPRDLDTRLLASLLYEEAGEPWNEILERLGALSPEEGKALFETLLADRGPRDPVPEGLEGGGLLDFEILVDFGAYRDIGRHRKGFQQQQRLTTEHGFVVPPLFDRAGLGERYREVLVSVGRKARRLGERFPFAAEYLIPFAYLQRVRLCFDPRQMFYFIELRSAPEGHFSYREVALRMAEALEEVAPLCSRWLRVCREAVFLGRVENERGAEERRRGREARARALGYQT